MSDTSKIRRPWNPNSERGYQPKDKTAKEPTNLPEGPASISKTPASGNNEQPTGS